ncbi:MAG: MotA/TolQ/ExbB proton channel family protein [Kiritimatiellia bacterium]
MLFSYGGVIFFIILMLEFVTVAVFFERLLHLRRAQIEHTDFISGVCNVLDRNNIDEAVMLCEDTPGPVAAVVLTAIRYKDGLLSSLRDAVDNTGRSEISRLERRVVALAVNSQVAPLLGLLGTLTGVIKIVMQINNQAPLIQNTDLTTGLMEALVTTVAGLIVAVTSYVMYALLMVRIERVVHDMESAASQIVAYFTPKESIS